MCWCLQYWDFLVGSENFVGSKKRRTSIVYRSFPCGPLEDWQTLASQEHIVTNFHVIKERWVTGVSLDAVHIWDHPRKHADMNSFRMLLWSIITSRRYFDVLSLCRRFHPADVLVREDADRATVTFADHSVREALLVGAEPDCYLAEVIIPRYPKVFFSMYGVSMLHLQIFVWYVFLFVRFCSLASCLGEDFDSFQLYSV